MEYETKRYGLIGIIVFVTIFVALIVTTEPTYDYDNLLHCEEGEYKANKDARTVIKQAGLEIDKVVVKQAEPKSAEICKAILILEPNLVFGQESDFAYCDMKCTEKRLANKCMLGTDGECIGMYDWRNATQEELEQGVYNTCCSQY